uniref:Coiled-coil domain-containing protein n=1 Tax=Oryctolagus cuniculus TaxID=9986 RepID=A0A5F9CF61_RABIT
MKANIIDQVRLLEETVRNQIPLHHNATLDSEAIYLCSRSRESLVQNQHSVGMAILAQAQDSSPGHNAIQNQNFYETQFPSQDQEFIHNEESINNQPDINATSYLALPQDLMKKPFSTSTRDSLLAHNMDTGHSIPVQYTVETQEDFIIGKGSDIHLGENQYPVSFEESNKIKYFIKRKDTVFKSAEFLGLTLSPNSVTEDVPQLKNVKSKDKQQMASSELNQYSLHSSMPLSPTMKGQKDRRKTLDNKSKLNLNIPSLKTKKTTSWVFQTTVFHTSKNRNELACKNNSLKKESHQRKGLLGIALQLISAPKLIPPYIKKYSRKKLMEVMQGLIKCKHFLQKQNELPATQEIDHIGSAAERSLSGITESAQQRERENMGIEGVSLKMSPQLEQSFVVNTDQLKVPCLLTETTRNSTQSPEDPIKQTKEISITELHAPMDKKAVDLHIPKDEAPSEAALSEPLPKLVSSPKMESNRRMETQEDLQSTENSHLQLSNGEELLTSLPKIQKRFSKENTQNPKDFLEIVLELSNPNLPISPGLRKHENREQFEGLKVQVNLKEKKQLIFNITECGNVREIEELECNTKSNIKYILQGKNTSDACHNASHTETPDMEIHSRLKTKINTSVIIRLNHSTLKLEILPDEKRVQNEKYIDKSSVLKKPKQYDREQEGQEEEKAIPQLTPQDISFSIYPKQNPKYIKFRVEQISLQSRKTQNKELKVQPQTLSILGTSSPPKIDPFQVKKVKQNTERPPGRESIIDSMNPPTMPENLSIGELLIETIEHGIPFGRNLSNVVDSDNAEEMGDSKRNLPAVALESFNVRRKKSGTKNVLKVKHVSMKVKKMAISLKPCINRQGIPSHIKNLGDNSEITIKQMPQDKIVADFNSTLIRPIPEKPQLEEEEKYPESTSKDHESPNTLDAKLQDEVKAIYPHTSVLPEARRCSGLNAENSSHIRPIQETPQLEEEEKYPESTSKDNESPNTLDTKLQDEVKRDKETQNLRFDAIAEKEIKTEKEMHQPIPSTEAIVESVDSPLIDLSHVESIKKSLTTQTDFRSTADSEMPPPIPGKPLSGDPLSQIEESGVPSNRSDTSETGSCYAEEKAGLPKDLPAAPLETCNCSTPVLSYSKGKKNRVRFASMETLLSPKCINMKVLKPSNSQVSNITGHRKKKSDSNFKTVVKKINQTERLVPDCLNTLCSPIHSQLQTIFCHTQLKPYKPAKKNYVDFFAKSSAFYDLEEKLQDKEEKEQKPIREAALQHSQHVWSDACQMKEIHLNKTDMSLDHLTQELPIRKQSIQHQMGFTESAMEASLKMDPTESEELQTANQTASDMMVTKSAETPPPQSGNSPLNEILNMTEGGLSPDGTPKRELDSYSTGNKSEKPDVQMTIQQSSDSIMTPSVSKSERHKKALRLVRKKEPVSLYHRTMREIKPLILRVTNGRNSKEQQSNEIQMKMKDSQQKKKVTGACLDIIHSIMPNLPKIKMKRSLNVDIDTQRKARIGRMHLMQDKSQNGRKIYYPNAIDVCSFSKSVKKERKGGPEVPQTLKNRQDFVFNAHQKAQKDNELVKSGEELYQPGSINIQIHPQTYFPQTTPSSSLCPILDKFQLEKPEKYITFSHSKSGEKKAYVFCGRENGILSDASHHKKRADGSIKKKAVTFDLDIPDLSTSGKKRNFKQFSDMKMLVNHRCGIIKAKKPPISHMLHLKGGTSPSHRKELGYNLTNKIKEVHRGKEVADKMYSFMTVTPDINMTSKIETEKDTQVKQEISLHEISITSDGIKEPNLKDEEEEYEQQALLEVIPQYSQHFVFCSDHRKDLDLHKNQERRKILFVTEQNVPQLIQYTNAIQGEELKKNLQPQDGMICTPGPTLPLLQPEKSLTGEVSIGTRKHGIPTDRNLIGELCSWDEEGKAELEKDLQTTALASLTASSPDLTESNRQRKTFTCRALRSEMSLKCVPMKSRKAPISHIFNVPRCGYLKNLPPKTLKSQFVEFLYSGVLSGGFRMVVLDNLIADKKKKLAQKLPSTMQESLDFSMLVLPASKRERNNLKHVDKKHKINIKCVTLKAKKPPISQTFSITGHGTPSHRRQSECHSKTMTKQGKPVADTFLNTISLNPLSLDMKVPNRIKEREMPWKMRVSLKVGEREQSTHRQGAWCVDLSDKSRTSKVKGQGGEPVPLIYEHFNFNAHIVKGPNFVKSDLKLKNSASEKMSEALTQVLQQHTVATQSMLNSILNSIPLEKLPKRTETQNDLTDTENANISSLKLRKPVSRFLTVTAQSYSPSERSSQKELTSSVPAGMIRLQKDLQARILASFDFSVPASCEFKVQTNAAQVPKSITEKEQMSSIFKTINVSRYGALHHRKKQKFILENMHKDTSQDMSNILMNNFSPVPVSPGVKMHEKAKAVKSPLRKTSSIIQRKQNERKKMYTYHSNKYNISSSTFEGRSQNEEEKEGKEVSLKADLQFPDKRGGRNSQGVLIPKQDVQPQTLGSGNLPESICSPLKTAFQVENLKKHILLQKDIPHKMDEKIPCPKSERRMFDNLLTDEKEYSPASDASLTRKLDVHSGVSLQLKGIEENLNTQQVIKCTVGLNIPPMKSRSSVFGDPGSDITKKHEESQRNLLTVEMISALSDSKRQKMVLKFPESKDMDPKGLTTKAKKPLCLQMLNITEHSNFQQRGEQEDNLKSAIKDMQQNKCVVNPFLSPTPVSTVIIKDQETHSRSKAEMNKLRIQIYNYMHPQTEKSPYDEKMQKASLTDMQSRSSNTTEMHIQHEEEKNIHTISDSVPFYSQHFNFHAHQMKDPGPHKSESELKSSEVRGTDNLSYTMEETQLRNAILETFCRHLKKFLQVEPVRKSPRMQEEIKSMIGPKIPFLKAKNSETGSMQCNTPWKENPRRKWDNTIFEKKTWKQKDLLRTTLKPLDFSRLMSSESKSLSFPFGKKSIMSPKHMILKAKQPPISQFFSIRKYRGHRKKNQQNIKYKMREPQCYVQVGEEALFSAPEGAKSTSPKLMMDKFLFDTIAKGTVSNRALQKILCDLIKEKKMELQENLVTAFLESLDFFMPDSKSQINTVQLSEKEIILNYECLTMKKKPPSLHILKSIRHFTTKHRKVFVSNLRTKMKAIWQGKNVTDTFPNTIYFTPQTSEMKKQNKFKTETDMQISKFSNAQLTQVESPVEGITRYSNSIVKSGISNFLKETKPHDGESERQKQERPMETSPVHTKNFTVNTYLMNESDLSKSEDVPLGESFFPRSQIYKVNPKNYIQIEKNKNIQASLKVGLPEMEKSNICAQLHEPTGVTVLNIYKKICHSVLKEQAPYHLTEIPLDSAVRHLPTSEEIRQQNDSLKITGISNPGGLSLKLSLNTLDQASISINKEETQHFKAQKTGVERDKVILNSQLKFMHPSMSILHIKVKESPRTWDICEQSCEKLNVPNKAKDREKVEYDQEVLLRTAPQCIQPFEFGVDQMKELGPCKSEATSISTVCPVNTISQETKIDIIDQEAKMKAVENLSPESAFICSAHQIEKQEKEFKTTNWKTIVNPTILALQKKQLQPCVLGALWRPYAYTPLYPETIIHKNKEKITVIKSALHIKQIKFKGKKTPVSQLLVYGPRSNKTELRGNTQQQRTLQLSKHAGSIVLKTTFDTECLTIHIKKLTDIKQKRDKLKERVCFLPQPKLETSNERQVSFPGYTDTPTIIKKLEQNISEEEQNHQSILVDIPQQFIQPVQIKSQPMKEHHAKLEDLQRKVCSEPPSQRGGTDHPGLGISRSMRGPKVYIEGQEAQQQKYFPVQETTRKFKLIAETNLELRKEPLHLKKTEELTAKQDLKLSKPQKKRGLKVTNSPPGAKEQLLIPGLMAQQQKPFKETLLESISTCILDQFHAEKPKEEVNKKAIILKSSSQQVKKISNEASISNVDHSTRNIERILLLIKEQENRRKKKRKDKKHEIEAGMKTTVSPNLVPKYSPAGLQFINTKKNVNILKQRKRKEMDGSTAIQWRQQKLYGPGFILDSVHTDELISTEVIKHKDKGRTAFMKSTLCPQRIKMKAKKAPVFQLLNVTEYGIRSNKKVLKCNIRKQEYQQGKTITDLVQEANYDPRYIISQSKENIKVKRGKDKPRKMTYIAPHLRLKKPLSKTKRPTLQLIDKSAMLSTIKTPCKAISQQKGKQIVLLDILPQYEDQLVISQHVPEPGHVDFDEDLERKPRPVLFSQKREINYSKFDTPRIRPDMEFEFFDAQSVKEGNVDIATKGSVSIPRRRKRSNKTNILLSSKRENVILAKLVISQQKIGKEQGLWKPRHSKTNLEPVDYSVTEPLHLENTGKVAKERDVCVNRKNISHLSGRGLEETNILLGFKGQELICPDVEVQHKMWAEQMKQGNVAESSLDSVSCPISDLHLKQAVTIPSKENGSNGNPWEKEQLKLSDSPLKLNKHKANFPRTLTVKQQNIFNQNILESISSCILHQLHTEQSKKEVLAKERTRSKGLSPKVEKVPNEVSIPMDQPSSSEGINLHIRRKEHQQESTHKAFPPSISHSPVDVFQIKLPWVKEAEKAEDSLRYYTSNMEGIDLFIIRKGELQEKTACDTLTELVSHSRTDLLQINTSSQQVITDVIHSDHSTSQTTEELTQMDVTVGYNKKSKKRQDLPSTGQKQMYKSISCESFLEHKSYLQDYPCLLPHLLPQREEALSEVSNVTDRKKELIVPSVPQREMKKQNIMLPLELCNRTINHMNLLFSEGKKSSNVAQITDSVSNGSSPKLRISSKKVESHKANKKVHKEVCLPGIFLHSLSICMPILNAYKEQKDSLKQGFMKDIICAHRRALRLRRSIVSHILNTTDCGTSTQRLDLQWNMKEDIITMKHRKSEPDLAVAKIYEPIPSLPLPKLDKETIDGVILNNVKTQSISQEEKDRMQTAKGSNIILKAKKSSLSNVLDGKEVPSILGITKSESKVQKDKGKPVKHITSSNTSLLSLSHPNLNSRTEVGKSESEILSKCLPPPKLQSVSDVRKILFTESTSRGSSNSVIESKCLPQKKKTSRENIVNVKDIMGLICITLQGKKSPFKQPLHGKKPQWTYIKKEKMIEGDKSNLKTVQSKPQNVIPSSACLAWDHRIREVYTRGIMRFCLPSLTLQELMEATGTYENPIDNILSSIKKENPMSQKDRMEIALEEIMHSGRIAFTTEQPVVSQELQLNIEESEKKMQEDENKQVEIHSKSAAISFLPHSEVDTRIKGEEAMQIKTRFSFLQLKLQESSYVGKMAPQESISVHISNSVKNTIGHLIQKEEERKKVEKVMPLKKRKSSVTQEIKLDIKEKKIEKIKGESKVVLINTSTPIPSPHLKLGTRIEKADCVSDIIIYTSPELLQKSSDIAIKANKESHEGITSKVQNVKKLMPQKEDKVEILAKTDMHSKFKDLKGKKELSWDQSSYPAEQGKVDWEDKEQRKMNLEGKEQGKWDQEGKEQLKVGRKGNEQRKMDPETREQVSMGPGGRQQGKAAPETREQEKAAPEIRNQGKEDPEIRKQRKAALETSEQEKEAPETTEQEKAAPETREQEKEGPETRDQRKAAPETREQGKAAPEMRQQGKAAPETREQEIEDLETREHEKAARETREQEKEGPETRDQRKEDPETRKQRKAALETSEQEKEALETMEQEKAALETREQVKESPETRDQGKAGSETKEQGRIAPESRKKRKAAPETREQEKAAPDTRKQVKSALETREQEIEGSKTKDQGKAAPETGEQEKEGPKTREQGKTSPETREQGKAVPETRKPGKAAPETREQGKAAPEMRQQGKAAPEVRQQGKAAPETREQGKAAPETREQEAAARETREQEIEDLETREHEKAARETREQEKAAPETGDQGKTGPETREQEAAATEMKEQENEGSETREQEKPGPDTREQGKAGPETRDQRKAAPETREQGKAAPEMRQQGKAAPETREQETEGLETRELEKEAPETTEQGKSVPENRKPGKAAPETREQENPDPETREEGKAAPETTDQEKAAPETKEQENEGPETREQAEVGPETREQEIEGLETREHENADPEIREQGKAAPETRKQEKESPETREQGEAAPETKEQAEAGPETREQEIEGLETREHENADPEIREEGKAAPETRKQEKESPETREQAEAGPETREQEIEGLETREHENTDPEIREQGKAAPETRKQEKESPETREQGVAAPKTREQAEAGPETREQEIEGLETREHENADPEIREEGKAAPETRKQEKESPETREQRKAAPETKEQAEAGPEIREQEIEGLETREHENADPEIREQGKTALETREQENEGPETREQGKAGQGGRAAGNMVPESIEPGNAALEIREPQNVAPEPIQLGNSGLETREQGEASLGGREQGNMDPETKELGNKGPETTGQGNVDPETREQETSGPVGREKGKVNSETSEQGNVDPEGREEMKADSKRKEQGNTDGEGKEQEKWDPEGREPGNAEAEGRVLGNVDPAGKVEDVDPESRQQENAEPEGREQDNVEPDSREVGIVNPEGREVENMDQEGREAGNKHSETREQGNVFPEGRDQGKPDPEDREIGIVGPEIREQMEHECRRQRPRECGPRKPERKGMWTQKPESKGTQKAETKGNADPETGEQGNADPETREQGNLGLETRKQENLGPGGREVGKANPETKEQGNTDSETREKGKTEQKGRELGKRDQDSSQQGETNQEGENEQEVVLFLHLPSVSSVIHPEIGHKKRRRKRRETRNKTCYFTELILLLRK